MFPVVVTSGGEHLDKKPATAHGFRDASTDPFAVMTMFTSVYRTGDVVVVGIVPGSAGLVVIDCDVKGGGDGRIVADEAGLPGTVVTTTPSGGEHRWFRKCESVPIGNRSPWPYCDVRADNGYVVAPGSWTPWGSWESHDDLGDAPVFPQWEALTVASCAGGDHPTEVASETEELVRHLTSLGATEHHRRGGVVYLTRPGKRDGVSATVGALGAGVLYNFSSEWLSPNVPLVWHLGTLRSLRDVQAERDAAWVANAQPRSSWLPIRDLATIARADRRVDVPTFCHRIDGPTLFYSGKLNALFGQSESGKTWLALAMVVQALGEGLRCAYADLEDSPFTFCERLRLIGCEPLPFVESGQLGYLAPTSPVEAEPLSGWDLLVIDSANELLTLNTEASINDNAFVTMAYRRLRQVAHDLSLCVVVIDHATNKEESGTAIGASAKRNAIDGTEAFLVNERPFTDASGGQSHVYVTKDRPGAVQGIDHRTSGMAHRRRAWSAMSLQPTITEAMTLGLAVSLEEPTPAEVMVRRDREAVDALVMATLDAHEGRLKASQIVAVTDLAHSTISKACTRLEMAGALHRESDPDDLRSPWIVKGPK